MVRRSSFEGSAIASALDFSVRNRLRVKRQYPGTGSAEKLARLARLRRQHLSGLLPRYRETQVEQSWNEQIFANVLGYKTQFSHDAVAFELKPKNYSKGRYDDFSIGSFGANADQVVGIAELKDASTDLDAPLGGNYGNVNPVEQAFRVARTHSGCRWVLVSNLAELRVYSIKDDTRPVAIALLREVRTRRDLALLMAHFDRHALLEGELSMALELDDLHPAMPVPAEDGSYRVVTRFTPAQELEIPLYDAEHRLKRAFATSPCWWRLAKVPDYGLGLELCSRFQEGWVGFDLTLPGRSGVMRASVDLCGQLQVSVRHPADLVHADGGDRSAVDILTAIDGVRLLTHMAAAYHGATGAEAPFHGHVSAELRDVEGARVDLHPSNGSALLRGDSRNNGVCPRKDIETGDFAFSIGDIGPTRVASGLIAELCIQFRNAYGGVALDTRKVQTFLDELDESDELTAATKRPHLRVEIE
jgi:hypothetical protein